MAIVIYYQIYNDKIIKLGRMHMDFFINIGLVGIAFIFLGKLTNKENKNIQEFNNLQVLNKLICYMESELFAKIHLKYGLQLLICGIISVFY